MRPVGPGVPDWASAVLTDMQDAIRALQKPGQPVALGSVDLKADLPDAGLYPNGHIICAEINSIVASTLVTGVWTWKRADGSAL